MEIHISACSLPTSSSVVHVLELVKTGLTVILEGRNMQLVKWESLTITVSYSDGYVDLRSLKILRFGWKWKVVLVVFSQDYVTWSSNLNSKLCARVWLFLLRLLNWDRNTENLGTICVQLFCTCALLLIWLKRSIKVNLKELGAC